jgi:hypothetical protein
MSSKNKITLFLACSMTLLLLIFGGSIYYFQKNYSYIICKQISNSYRLLEFDRLPLRTRPKALKMIDKNLVLNLEPRHYHEKNGKLYSSRNKAIL